MKRVLLACLALAILASAVLAACNNNCRHRRYFRDCLANNSLNYAYNDDTCINCVGSNLCEADDFASPLTCVKTETVIKRVVLPKVTPNTCNCAAATRLTQAPLVGGLRAQDFNQQVNQWICNGFPGTNPDQEDVPITVGTPTPTPTPGGGN